MRLVCPSCEAKYEVPDDAIPDSGRDVQCANCGHAWFQTRSRAVSATTPLTEAVETPAPSVAASAAPTPEPAEATVSEAATAPPADAAAAEPSKAETSGLPSEGVRTSVDAPSDTVDPAANPPEPEELLAAEALAPAVDEKVLTILREEAEREAKARRDEGRPLESQPDLGIETAPAPRKKAAVKKRDPEPEPGPEAAAKPAARRDLLPDVEEINSTLRPSEEPVSEFVGGMPEAEPREGRGAFRAGFLLVISFAILGASIYMTAGWLSVRVPALAGPLEAYVDLIDRLRLGLDGLMQSATQLISGDKG